MKVRILGIDFFHGDARSVIDQLRSGGLLVVPAAPALVTITVDKDYLSALKMADIVIPDSGYMVLIWNLFHRRKINRISGLELLFTFLTDEGIKGRPNILLVDPRPKEAAANLAYLSSIGIMLEKEASYIAPFYLKENVVDVELLTIVEKIMPKYIIINLGGGTQEKLGAYLMKNLSYRPAIICTGAAIAFLTGLQARIPIWVDKIYMGWFVRCMENPKIYIPRYLKAFKLVKLMLLNGSNAPKMRGSDYI